MAEVVFYSIANLVTLSLNEALIKDLWHCFNRKKEILTKCVLFFSPVLPPKFWRKPVSECWVSCSVEPSHQKLSEATAHLCSGAAVVGQLSAVPISTGTLSCVSAEQTFLFRF